MSETKYSKGDDNIELAYSLHLGSDKNKKNSIRKSGKSNASGSTSMGNNAIQNATGLSKADNHNCRKYDNDRENIEVIKGSFSIYEDVKKLYQDEFEEARLEYNSRQVREDRKINDYFSHVSNNSKNDLACEIIIELGDKNFWDTKDMNYKKKMTNVFKEQVKDLEKIVPNFKIASAIIHYDETSPHLHIIGVPIKYNNKYGLSKQVGKSNVFTKESLVKIQDKMRILCIESFNKEYLTNNKLKPKLKGRNKDFHVSEMDNYQKMKRNIEVHKNNLDIAKEQTQNLSNKSKEIRNILENLKSKGLVKNQLIMDVTNRDEVIAFIDLVDRSINEYKSSQEVLVTLKEGENELINNRQRINQLLNNNEQSNNEINKLKDKINSKTTEISELKKENNLLKSSLEHFKTLVYNLIKFLMDKIFMSKEKEKYMEFAKELYKHSVLEENDFNMLQDNKNIKKQNNLEIEKDDFEH